MARSFATIGVVGPALEDLDPSEEAETYLEDLDGLEVDLLGVLVVDLDPCHHPLEEALSFLGSHLGFEVDRPLEATIAVVVEDFLALAEVSQLGDFISVVDPDSCFEEVAVSEM